MSGAKCSSRYMFRPPGSRNLDILFMPLSCVGKCLSDAAGRCGGAGEGLRKGRKLRRNRGPVGPAPRRCASRRRECMGTCVHTPCCVQGISLVYQGAEATVRQRFQQIWPPNMDC